MLELNLCYSNDRGDPSPERIHEEGDDLTQPPSHGRFWFIRFKNGKPSGDLLSWYMSLPSKMTMREAGEALDGLATRLGIELKNTGDQEEWRKHGFEVYAGGPASMTFVNWPDPDLKKGYG